jgi:xanthine dehydrogenase YagS FAD-binding subunit
MKDYIESPKRVVYIGGIKELSGVSKSSNGIRIGAITTFDELMNAPLLRNDFASLVQAARGIASPQIRNMGTVAGDLCQRPRCWYYRNGFGLLAMKDGKSLIPDGENQYHAIFSNGSAHFVSPSSLGPPLIALGATIKVASAGGNRDIPAAEFFVAPTGDGMREIALKPNELITEITIPAAAGQRSSTYEIREREALDWPLATASVALRMKGNNVESAKIVLGHVGPTPHVAADAASSLAGKSISEATAEQAGAAAVGQAKPLSGNAYKVNLAKVAVKRALLAAAGVKA